MNLTEQIQKQLARLPTDRALNYKGTDAWIRCPWHKNGQERTGSLVIHTARSVKGPAGGWICWGCKKSGQWADFAKPLNLKKFGQYFEEEAALDVMEADRKEFFGTEGHDTPEGVEWPAEQKWRGIDGRMVQQVGGVLFFSPIVNRSQLYLPVKIWDEQVGGIKCTLNSKYARKYINDSGNWSHNSVFPYDYVAKQLKGKKYKVITLVEGPRDALTLNQYGMLALSMIGSGTVWSEEKGSLILSLDPDLIILGFDPDEAGDNVAKKAVKFFRKANVKIMKLKFPESARTNKRDPANLKLPGVTRICQKLKIPQVMPPYLATPMPTENMARAA